MKNQLISLLLPFVDNQDLNGMDLIKLADEFTSEITAFLDNDEDAVTCYRKLSEALHMLSILNGSCTSKNQLKMRYFLKSVRKSIRCNISLLASFIKERPKVNGKHHGLLGYNWVASKSDFVELTYALLEIGAVKRVDGKKIQIEKLCQEVALCFGLEVPKPSQKFHEIQNRKGVSRTYFLNSLTEVLGKRLNDRDN